MAISHATWDRLAQEFDTCHMQAPRVDYNKNVAATIELSLASPMFRELGPDGHDLLGVVAFFPQGIDKNNLDWFFPTIPDRKNILDVLSLTYRSNGFITMLAPLRDYLCPEDQTWFPQLRTAMECLCQFHGAPLLAQTTAGRAGAEARSPPDHHPSSQTTPTGRLRNRHPRPS
jgi:hypothetical protein